MTDQEEAQTEIAKLTKEIIKIDDTLFITSEDLEYKEECFERRAYLLQQIEEIKALYNL